MTKTATPAPEPKWESLTSSTSGSEKTDRLAVPGGWIYRTRCEGMGAGVSTVFVPYPLTPDTTGRP